MNSPRSRDILSNHLRTGFARYINSYRFKQYIRRMYAGAKWWNPVHQLAVRVTRSQARKEAWAIATQGHPMIGALMMQNVVLENPKAVAPALVLGTFDVSPNGRTQLDRMAAEVDRIKLGDSGDPEFERFLEEIYGDEEFTPGRRRAVPGSKSKLGNTLYFMDVMIRGDDAIQTGTSHDLMSHPTIVMLGQQGTETGVEVMPREVAELAIHQINGEATPKKVKYPKFRSPLRMVVLYLYAVFGLLALSAVGMVVMNLKTAIDNPPPLTGLGAEETHILTVSKGPSSGTNEQAAANAKRLSIRLQEWKQEVGATPKKESRISMKKGEFVVRCIEQPDRTIYLIGLPKLAYHADNWTPQLKEFAWQEATRIAMRSDRAELPLVVALKGFVDYPAIVMGLPKDDTPPNEINETQLEKFFPNLPPTVEETQR